MGSHVVFQISLFCQLSHHQNDNDFQWYEYEYFTWSHLSHRYHVSYSHNLHRWKGRIHYLTTHSHWEAHWKFQLVHKVIDIFMCIEHTKFARVLVANHTWFTRFLHKMPQDIRVSFVQAQISQVIFHVRHYLQQSTNNNN